MWGSDVINKYSQEDYKQKPKQERKWTAQKGEVHGRLCDKAWTDIVQLRNSLPWLFFLLFSSITHVSFPFSKGRTRLPNAVAFFVHPNLPQAHPVFTSRVPQIDTVCLIFRVTHRRWRYTWHSTQFGSLCMSQLPFQKRKCTLNIFYHRVLLPISFHPSDFHERMSQNTRKISKELQKSGAESCLSNIRQQSPRVPKPSERGFPCQCRRADRRK